MTQTPPRFVDYLSKLLRFYLLLSPYFLVNIYHIHISSCIVKMAPKGKGENTKKAAGNAKKAEVAAQKKAVEDAKQEAAETRKWDQGSKDNSKAYVTT